MEKGRFQESREGNLVSPLSGVDPLVKQRRDRRVAIIGLSVLYAVCQLVSIWWGGR